MGSHGNDLEAIQNRHLLEGRGGVGQGVGGESWTCNQRRTVSGYERVWEIACYSHGNNFEEI